MAYFKYIPDLLYQSLEGSESSTDTQRVKNLFRRGKIRDDIFNVLVYFDKYSIEGNDRPDNVAEKIYGSGEYDWVVLMSNNIINIREEWPLTNMSFETYMIGKYGVENLNSVHHYETTEIKDPITNRLIRPGGIIISTDSYNSYKFDYSINGSEISLDKSSLKKVTNYEFEFKINEDKRSIYLLKKQFLTTIENDLINNLKYEPSTNFVDDFTKKTI